MVDSFAVRPKMVEGECDATESSLKDWKAIAVDFSLMKGQLRGNVSSENYTIFHDVNFRNKFLRLKSEDQNSFTMESLILAQDER